MHNILSAGWFRTVFAILPLLFGACTAMKFVPEGKALYTEAEVKVVPSGKVKAKRTIKTLLEDNILPEPNKTFLGMRPGLWFFYKAGNPKKKGLRSFMKNKLGKPPVYMSDMDHEQIAGMLKGHLFNNGYFQAWVEPEATIKGKKGKLKFTAFVHEAYRIREIRYPEMDTLFANIDSIKNDSYIEPGQRYSLERLEAEQGRIEEALENMGFYFFDDRHLIFEGDSTVGERKVDLLLTLEKGVPPKARQVYRLNEITVFPYYSLMLDSVQNAGDTLEVNGYHYIQNPLDMFRPEIVTSVINLKKGNIYRRIDREYTLSHLMGLGAFKFVDIRFREADTDSALLNANIYLTPHLKKSIRMEFQGTSKSNNFVGPAVTMRFTNRNTLRGGERLDITANTGYEVQISRKIAQPLSAFEFGVESSLSIPRIISPFDIYYPSRKYLPSTDVKLGFRVQQRIGFFRLNSFNLGYGYTWRENTLKTHELFPVDISYVDLGKTSDPFDRLVAKNPFLERSFASQFILGSRYSYTLNTQVNEKWQEKYREEAFRRSQYYFNASVDVAGNLVHLVQDGFRNREDQEPLKIFGSIYSQFARGEVDFRYYWQFDKTNLVATRITGGLGYAYGNTNTMPYIKQFAIGGATSIRAFPARSIGPGTYYIYSDPETENRLLFVDQRGDVRIEGNVEYRVDFTRVIEGAVFVDAGNIWLVREDVNRPGSKFEGSRFLDELAVGTGMGIRLDFNFFVLRFDLAFPLRKPWLPENERWVIDEVKFGSSRWRSDNLVLNIAIGYPF